MKPPYDLQWATDSVTSGTSGNPNKLEPFEFKSEGQQEGLPVPRQYLNFQFDAIRQWKDYFEGVTDSLLASSSAALLRSNNLSDLTNAATARTNLGLTSVATSLYADATQAATGTSAITAMSPARTTDHFNARTTALTRVILGRTDAVSIRSDLGLGSASQLDTSGVVQTTGNQSVGGSKTFTSPTTILDELRVGTGFGDPVTTSIRLGYITQDFYGFRCINNSNASNVFAGEFKLQRGTGASWGDVFTVSNSGVVSFTSTVTANINGNSTTVSNGVYTVGSQSIGGVKTFTSQVLAPSFRVSSDPELKDNLIEHSPVNGVDKIKLMQWVWKQHDNVPEHLWGKEDSGVDASVVKQVFPNCVGEDSNGFLVVDYAKLAVHLILAKGE